MSKVFADAAYLAKFYVSSGPSSSNILNGTKAPGTHLMI